MSPAYSSDLISAQRADEKVAISARWRGGQIALIAAIGLFAAWFALVGWKSPATETGAADHFSPFDLTGFLVLAGAVWLTTPTTWTIATTTFQEAIRRRWMTALLGFALVMLAVSTFFTWMQAGEEQKFLRDFGVGFTVIMTLIVAIFLGVALVPPEIERRIIFTILSKPVNRVEFLLGKYTGLLMVLLLNLVLMSAMFLLAYSLFVIRQEGGIASAFAADGQGISKQGLAFDIVNLSKALGSQFGLVAIVGAAALAFSQVMANITAIISSFVLYFLGQSASYWEYLAGQGAGGSAGQAAVGPVFSPFVRGLVNSIYFLLPRLDRYDLRERLVNDLPIQLNYLIKADSAGLVYIGVLLVVAYFFFGDREF